jgi:hypothetical protein
MKIKLRSVGDWLLRDFLAPERDLYANLLYSRGANSRDLEDLGAKKETASGRLTNDEILRMVKVREYQHLL